MKLVLLTAALIAAPALAQITPLTVASAPHNSVRVGKILIVKSPRLGKLTPQQTRLVSKIERGCEASMMPSEPVRRKYGGPDGVAIAYCASMMIDEHNRSHHDLSGIAAVALRS